MATYTADAVALLTYLVDALPERADELFEQAEAGESVIHAPSTAVAETLYAVSREKDVRGVRLSAQPETVQRALLADGPLSLAPPDGDELAAFSAIVGSFGIHDAMVVASHRARETEAIITSDAVLEAADIETVWE